MHLIPYVQIIQKGAFLPFWSPKIRGKHFLILTKSRILGLFGIFEGKRKGQKVEGRTPPRLNAPTSTTDNPQQATTSTRDNRRGKFSTPGYGAVEGWGVTPYITRGTKTGNKVLSLWKGGKRKWEKKKD